MKKITSKIFRKRTKIRRPCQKARPGDIRRAWTLAARLEHRRIKNKKK